MLQLQGCSEVEVIIGVITLQFICEVIILSPRAKLSNIYSLATSTYSTPHSIEIFSNQIHGCTSIELHVLI